MTRKELALLLYGAGAIQLQDVDGGAPGFKLKVHDKHPGAPLSPIYINLRGEPKGKLPPEILRAIGYHIADVAMVGTGVSSVPTMDAIVGLPKAGEPIAEAFARRLEVKYSKSVNLLTLEKYEGEEGRQIKPILHGDWEPCRHVVMIDDLVTEAGTKREGAAALRANGVIVEHCYVLLDRSENAKEKLAESEIELHSVFSLTNLLGWYLEEELIDEATYTQVLAYPKRLSGYIASQAE